MQKITSLINFVYAFHNLKDNGLNLPDGNLLDLSLPTDLPPPVFHDDSLPRWAQQAIVDDMPNKESVMKESAINDILNSLDDMPSWVKNHLESSVPFGEKLTVYNVSFADNLETNDEHNRPIVTKQSRPHPSNSVMAELMKDTLEQMTSHHGLRLALGQESLNADDAIVPLMSTTTSDAHIDLLSKTSNDKVYFSESKIMHYMSCGDSSVISTSHNLTQNVQADCPPDKQPNSSEPVVTDNLKTLSMINSAQVNKSVGDTMINDYGKGTFNAASGRMVDGFHVSMQSSELVSLIPSKRGIDGCHVSIETAELVENKWLKSHVDGFHVSNETESEIGNDYQRCKVDGRHISDETSDIARDVPHIKVVPGHHVSVETDQLVFESHNNHADELNSGSVVNECIKRTGKKVFADRHIAQESAKDDVIGRRVKKFVKEDSIGRETGNFLWKQEEINADFAIVSSKRKKKFVANDEHDASMQDRRKTRNIHGHPSVETADHQLDDAIRLQKFRERNTHGHSSVSTVQKLLYGIKGQPNMKENGNCSLVYTQSIIAIRLV